MQQALRTHHNTHCPVRIAVNVAVPLAPLALSTFYTSSRRRTLDLPVTRAALIRR